MPPAKFLSSIYAELASSYTATGHADTAVIFLQKALQTNPENNTLRFKIAYQYDYFLHKPYEALPWYKGFLKHLEPGPEHGPLEAIYGKPILKSGIPEISVSLPEYTKNRIKQIGH
jgi:tetratricopeptide (TPR) repeat protein